MYQTSCCIVGGGPAGMLLAYLLAKQGIDTTLLEAHHDFDRDFRGDTLYSLTGRMNNGHFLIQLDRGEQWQCGFSIPKGAYPQLRTAGLDALRQSLVDTVPEFRDRLDALQDWRQITLLSIQADQVASWFKPGLLLIGDVAHVMSPVGGNGINYAIQDVVATANILTAPLRTGSVAVDDLARV